MRTPLLVLVRWQGDIISAHTVEQGRRGVPAARRDREEGLAPGADMAGVGVSVEVVDVTAERAALGRRLAPRLDLRAAYALMVSGSLHLGLVLVGVAALVTHPPSDRLEVDDPNRRAAMTENPIIQVAKESVEPGIVEPAKEEPRPPVDPTPPSDVLGLTAPPETGEQASPTELLGLPTEEPGATSPGTGGMDPVTASAATCTRTPAPKNTGKVCSRTVVVTSLEIPPGCFTDTVLQLGQTGTLTFPCEGDGEARLAFGGKAFAGASLGGRLEMCAGTEYPFSDGCRWTSAQRVRGRLGMGDLAFEYGEAPKAGTHKSCARACSASGRVHVK